MFCKAASSSSPSVASAVLGKRFVSVRVSFISLAAIAQLGERQTEDLKVPGSIPGLGILLRAGIVALLRVASLQVLQSETIAI